MIVLLVLVLFSAVAAMFVITARQFHSGAVASQSLERYDRDHAEQLERALMTILRGSNNPYCSIRHHGILEDYYGSNDSLPPLGDITPSGEPNYPRIANAAAVNAAAGWSSGMVAIQIVEPADPALARLKQRNGWYNGCVLTVLDGDARMQSTRIVGYQFENISGNRRLGTFYVLAFKNGAVPAPVPGLPLPRVLINGRPFNGSGFGMNPVTGRNDMLNPSGLPYGLTPNAAAFQPTLSGPAIYDDPAGPGGADEDYDAVDYDNMHLAGRFWDAANGRWVVLLPSYYRPDLVNWYAKNSGSAANPAFQRQYILRPVNLFSTGQLAFDGSNPSSENAGFFVNPDSNNNGILDMLEDMNNNNIVDMLEGRLRWDVDNDGDGICDSIWIDPGFPVQKDAQGQLYKPLIAVMIQDMDSRLNLNVHANFNHTAQGGGGGPTTISGPALAGGFSPTAVLPRGQGAGPHETRGDVLLSQAELQSLMEGVPPAGNLLGEGGRSGEYPIALGGNVPYPGLTDFLRDASDIVRNIDYPSGAAQAFSANKNLNDDNVGPDGAGNPLMFPVYDWDGEGLVYVDKGGRIVHVGYGEFLHTNALIRQHELEHMFHINPYPDRKRNVLDGNGRRVAVDGAFSMAEAEFLLRFWDVDAGSMQSRLSRLVPALTAINGTPAQRAFLEERRGLLTAESYNPPVYSALATPEQRLGLRSLQQQQPGQFSLSGNHAIDLLYAKLALVDTNGDGAPDYTLPADRDLFENTARLLFPPEVAGGVRMNLNRLFGNGRDDDGDGIVDPPWLDMNGDGVPDTPGERDATGGPERVWWNGTQAIPPTYGPQTQAQFAAYRNIPFDANNDGAINFRDALARQEYARHLYALMMLFKDRAYNFPFDRGPGDPSDAIYTAMRLAQWAVNVADFKDPDSIMTGFEYDLNPFVDDDGNTANGTWDVDGLLSTDEGAHRAIAWGNERPLLVLTESLAFHEFRTEDLDNDDGDNDFYADPNVDPTKDDDFDQQRRPRHSTFVEMLFAPLVPVPFELRNPAYPNENALDLSRLAPAAPGAAPQPVWRLAMRRGPDQLSRPNPPPPNPDTAHLDPTQPDNNAAESFVWFTSSAAYGGNPNTLNPGINIYYTDLPANPPIPDPENTLNWNMTSATAYKMYQVRPGQYTVVGSRNKTKVGRTGAGANTLQNQHTIQLLDENAAQPQGYLPMVFNTPSGYPAANQIRSPMGVIINAPRELSISGRRLDDPTDYPAPNADTPDPDNAAILYRDRYSPPLDAPLDPAGQRQSGLDQNAEFTVYLQRLANPLEPYDPVSNPYITVDYSPVDLWRFNGESATKDPADMGTREDLETRERFDPTSQYNIWAQQSRLDEPRNGIGTPPNFFHSLGYLNSGYAANGMWDNTVGPNYAGMPRGGPFPVLDWHDRPFNSPAELLLVPASSPSRLLHEFSTRRPAPRAFVNHYRDRSPSADEQGPGSGFPFNHLINFFYSSDVVSSEIDNQWSDPNDGNDIGPPGEATSNFHRVLEFLQVPSKYEGTEEILNPLAFTGNNLVDPFTGNAVAHPYHPPFNRVSNQRDPGLVNANTTFDDGLVWRSILNDLNDPAAVQNHWGKVWSSRQGYGTNTAGILLNANSPTCFANPFRSYTSAYNVPPTQFAPANSSLLYRQANLSAPIHELTDATFLRLHPDNEGFTGLNDPKRPLLASETNLDLNGFTGFGNARAAYNDGDRNAYFRYQPMNKLVNTMTHRSNVYAIWITVGYFRCHQERGEDHNVRSGILVSRIIE
ncbi:MAG: hypothetical protein HYS13_05280 [Planctomycetia bacterium]|nr:hypothetical protein [Planctomycetia bacterium]